LVASGTLRASIQPHRRSTDTPCYACLTASLRYPRRVACRWPVIPEAAITRKEPYMESINALVNSVNGLVWGPPMLVAILGTGLFLMLFLRFMPLARIGTGFALMWRGRRRGDAESGEISPFEALMTCLAA